MWGYKSELDKIDKLRKQADKKLEKSNKIESNIINKFYDKNPPKKIEALRKIIEDSGLEWEKKEFIDFHERYNQRKINVSHIRSYNKIHKKYGCCIKCKSSFFTNIDRLWKGND